MTDDLVARLKEANRLMHRPLLRDAADRIEHLEVRLREIAELNINEQAALAVFLARAALEGKDG